MPVTDERRSEEEIRREIESERDQLADALSDLKAGIDEKRKPAARAGGAIAAGLALVTALRLVRRFRRR